VGEEGPADSDLAAVVGLPSAGDRADGPSGEEGPEAGAGS
jgi:hypothetical protein